MSDEVKGPEVSVVVPLHNEEGNLSELCRRLVSTLDAYGRPFELVLVDDGSDDSSPALLAALSAADPRLCVVTLARNSGQWAAVEAGLHASRGDHVVVMDADLQHAPEEVPLLVEKAREGWDLVSGWRRSRSESMLARRLPSLVANWLTRAATGCTVHDMGGFKCLRGEWARQLSLTPGSHRFLPALVHLRGGAVTEAPISAPPRARGHSHYGLRRLPEVALDIAALWFQAAYLGRPLHLLGKLAALLISAGAAVMAWLLYDKLGRGLPMGTRPPFTLAVLSILLGVQCLVLGFLADTLSRVHSAVTGHRPYHVKAATRSAGSRGGGGPEPRSGPADG